ncbi:hypothetical protein ACQKP2_33000, partial [Pseudomonas sp. NPDC089569]
MQRYSGFGLFKHSLSHHENWQRMWRTPTPKKVYDVVIVGGGGHGLATAYYLAKGQWVAGADYSANINPSELSDNIGDYARADL